MNKNENTSLRINAGADKRQIDLLVKWILAEGVE